MQQVIQDSRSIEVPSTHQPLSIRSATQVSDADVQAFERDGVVCLRGVFNSDWCELLKEAALEALDSGAGRPREVQNKTAGSGRFYSNVYLSDLDWRFRLLRDRSPAPEVAATLMRSDSIRFYYDQLFVKTPSAGAPTPWHNDLPFWPFRGNDLISMWIALSPVTTENSGLQYVAGSHRWGKMFRAVTPDYDPNLADESMPVCPDYGSDAGDQAGKLLSWDMQPGDVLCHHPLTVHGASGNKSTTETRIGLSVRFLGQDVQWDPRPRTMRLRHDPGVQPGAFPADDVALPVVWERSSGLRALAT